MNKILMLVGVAAAAVAVWLLLSRTKDPKAVAADPAGSATTSGSASASTATPAAKTKPVDKVGRVSHEERKRLAEQIAKARANRPAPSTSGAASATTRPELADNGDTKLVRTTMKDAMKELLPILADCYDKGGDKLPAEIRIVAKMTLTGDPDIGTIVDQNGIADSDGKPLEGEFDLCLKDALVSIQMPPLSEGGEVSVTYPMLFTRNGPPDGSANAQK